MRQRATCARACARMHMRPRKTAVAPLKLRSAATYGNPSTLSLVLMAGGYKCDHMLLNVVKSFGGLGKIPYLRTVKH